MRNALQTQDV